MSRYYNEEQFELLNRDITNLRTNKLFSIFQKLTTHA